MVYMSTLISLIIPVYNVESFLSECLDSILDQTDSNYEVIVVDDGSTDCSLNIAEEYQALCSRIKVVHQANAGVSAARNKGIALAQGEYIAFVDSDDWLDSDYLKRLREPLDKGVDLVTVGMFDCESAEKCDKVQNACTYLPNLNEANQFLALLKSKRLTGPCCKLYKTAIIKDNGLRFSEDVSFAEDKEFVARYVSFCNSAFISDYCGYYYRCAVTGSLSKKIHPERYLTEYRIWEIWFDTINKRQLLSPELSQYLAHELYYILSDSIVGANASGYVIPKPNFVAKKFLSDNAALVDDSNVVRRFLITRGLYKVYEIINSRRF